MHRDPALIPLSHDHQHVLARALRLRRAAPLDAAGRQAGAEAFLAFVDERFAPHFEAEERLLELACADAPDAAELVAESARLREEHAALLAAVEQLRAACAAGDPLEPELLRVTGQQVTDHVRYEERELFELLQSHFGPDELDALARRAGHDG
jgi:hypothetical protein